MILTHKQIRMLELLDEQVLSCKDCTLHHNGGRCKPYWRLSSKYAILGEAPGADEIKFNEPFFGRAGAILWGVMANFDLCKDDFVIVNSVNCRPVKESQRGWVNSKPEEHHQGMCRKWFRKYFKVVKPRKMIVFGNYAMGTLINEYSGIIKHNAEVLHNKEFDIPYVLSIHPAFCIYNEDGIPLLENSIEAFRSLAQETYSDDFMNDEELWKI